MATAGSCRATPLPLLHLPVRIYLAYSYQIHPVAQYQKHPITP
jgi:hypothetical protein